MSQSTTKHASAYDNAAACYWAGCTVLESQPLGELERGLQTVRRHPAAYAAGFSYAKRARVRLEAVLAQQA